MNKELLKFCIDLKDDLKNEIISKCGDDYPQYDLHSIIEKITSRINQELENE